MIMSAYTSISPGPEVMPPHPGPPGLACPWPAPEDSDSGPVPAPAGSESQWKLDGSGPVTGFSGRRPLPLSCWLHSSWQARPLSHHGRPHHDVWVWGTVVNFLNCRKYFKNAGLARDASKARACTLIADAAIAKSLSWNDARILV